MNTKFNLTTIKISSLTITLLSALFSGSLAYAVSSDYKSIPATILTPDARPIVMLTMTNDHQLSYKAYTDFDGNFEIENIKPGNYNIIASYISYDKSLVENFDANCKDNKVDIKLQESN
jgi:hypothetical protein